MNIKNKKDHIISICNQCAVEKGGIREPGTIAKVYIATCSVCNKNKYVSDPHDFGLNSLGIRYKKTSS